MPAEKPIDQTDADGKAIKWQAQKSAMTRARILDATIVCFIKHGYNYLTTTKVADVAGISRGAMRHHFTSKKDLIQTAIKHLHKKIFDNYLELIATVPENLTGRERIRAGLNVYWDHINSDIFLVYQELCMIARTKTELKEMLEESVSKFEHYARKSTVNLFSEWEGHSDRLYFAIDTSKFLMEGMALGQVVTNREQRVERQLDYLAIHVEEILNDDGTTEISKYFHQ
ncbi:MAG: AcrR family transcriptional regulator [Pseudohongiellaceae bacterium]|jgi:AcrR family transcriptional regulator